MTTPTSASPPATTAFALIALVALAACGGASPPPVEARDVTLAAADFDRLPDVALHLTDSACATPAADCGLSQVLGGAEGPGGEIALINGLVPAQLLLLTRDGQVRRVGRSGDGPGEYRIVHAVGFDADGSLAALSLTQRRVVRFDPSASAQTTHTTALSPGMPFDQAFVRGEFRVVTTEKIGEADSAEVAVFALAADAGSPRRLHGLGIREPAKRIGDFVRMQGLFAPSAQWAQLRDGAVLHSPGAEWLVERFDSLGHRDLTVRSDRAPRAVVDADLAPFVARTARIPSGGLRSAMELQQRMHAERHPSVSGLFAAGDGAIWVRETPRPGLDSVGWIHLARDGTPLGRLFLAADDRFIAAHDSTVVLVQDDGAGQPRVGWATLRAVSRRR